MNKEAEILSLPIVDVSKYLTDLTKNLQSIRDGMKQCKEKYTVTEVEMSIQALKHLATRQDITTEYRQLLMKDLRQLQLVQQILTGVFFI